MELTASEGNATLRSKVK